MPDAKHPKAPENQVETRVEAAVRSVLIATGRIVPQTPDEVRVAEGQSSQISLPANLQSPPTGPRGNACGRETIIRMLDSKVSENLARAAKNGGQISPDVLARMERDRLEAEKNTKKNSEP